MPLPSRPTFHTPVHQVWLKRRHTEWYKKFQYVSTSGVNAAFIDLWEQVRTTPLMSP